MEHWIQKQWQSTTCWHLMLTPLSWLFSCLVFVRRCLYQLNIIKIQQLAVPVIVVGNISVGGTGKTPFVIWLAEQLVLAGYKPGIISRGYGGSSKQVVRVLPDSRPDEVGDEPVMIARRTLCPVFVGANRVAAGQMLLVNVPECDVVISDDGLQHYRLHRDVEVVLINSDDSFGNGHVLPAGPLRESMTRLKHVTAIVDSSISQPISTQKPPVYKMQLIGDEFENINQPSIKVKVREFLNKPLVAIAGIGKPQRFFNHLSSFGLMFSSHSFPDHHQFAPKDLMPFAQVTLVMTEKDAVKCDGLVGSDAWYLPVKTSIENKSNQSLIELIVQKLKVSVSHG